MPISLISYFWSLHDAHDQIWELNVDQPVNQSGAASLLLRPHQSICKSHAPSYPPLLTKPKIFEVCHLEQKITPNPMDAIRCSLTVPWSKMGLEGLTVLPSAPNPPTVHWRSRSENASKANHQQNSHIHIHSPFRNLPLKSTNHIHESGAALTAPNTF